MCVKSYLQEEVKKSFSSQNNENREVIFENINSIETTRKSIFFSLCGLAAAA